MQSLFAVILLIINANGQQQSGTILPKLEECGKSNEEYLYNNEHVTRFDEFPWIARIDGVETEGDTEITPLCTGVLISKRYVLSTCPMIDHASKVLLGEWDTTNKPNERDCNDRGECAPLPVEYEIEEVVKQTVNQVMTTISKPTLLRLSTDVKFTDQIQPICLPTAGQTVTNGGVDLMSHYYYAAGFDYTNTQKKVKSLVQVMSMTRCRKRFSRYDITDNVICTSCVSPVTLSTGAALMGVAFNNSEPLRYYLLGIYSSGTYGSRVCNANPTDLYTKVSSHIEWIKYNMF